MNDTTPIWQFLDKDNNLIVEFDAINDLARAGRFADTFCDIEQEETEYDHNFKKTTKFLEDVEKSSINKVLIILKHARNDKLMREMLEKLDNIEGYFSLK